jgi:Lar family restriction alleviation protein
MTSPSELEPCPVCGNKPKTVARYGRVKLHCAACATSGPEQGSKEAAIAAWNAFSRGRRS